MENYNKVLKFMTESDKPLRAGDIAEGTGLDKKEVDKVMKKLKEEEKIVSPKRCFWEAK